MKSGSQQPWISPTWDAPASVIALTTTCRTDNGNDNADFNLAAHVGDNPESVQRNREQLQQRLGGQIDFQWLDQVHGTKVVTAKRGEGPQEADAVYTCEPDLACCVLTADCLPVFLTVRSGQAVAVAHAGWRGLAAGVLENTVASFPAAEEQMIAWLGPAIGPCHFQVGAEVREAFLDSSNGLKTAFEACFVADAEAGKYRADLYRLASARLANLGVEVSGGGFCTYCEPDRFYSYRRQRNTGRMASLIYLKS
jgi:YfiH family protein